MKQVTSFLGASLLVLLLLAPVQAGEISWKPRTPAGGTAFVDPDYYFLLLQNSINGTSSTRQFTDTFVEYPFKKGYFETADDGSVLYFDLAGERVDPRDVLIDTDPNNPDHPETGVTYFKPPRTVTGVE